MCCRLVKYGLFLANLVFTLGGLALIGLGVAALLQLTDVLKVITTNVDSIPITIIVLGALVFLISFLGCCGAIRENRCFLTLYGICMMVLAAGKIYVTVVIFQNLGDIRNTVEKLLSEAFQKEEIRGQYNNMETLFQCCGTFGPLSYFGALPPSCCPTTLQTCVIGAAYEGCNKIVGDFFEVYGEIIGIIVGVIVGVEILAIILTFCFCNTIGNRRSATV